MSPALLSAILLASTPVPSPPCAACVTWRAAPETARRLLEPPGRLDGLDVLLEVEAEAADVARDLSARGATVGLEVPFDLLPDAGVVAGPWSAIVLAVPSGTPVDEHLLFTIRTRATSIRAEAPGRTVGLSGAADLLAAVSSRGLAPYVSVLVGGSSPSARPGSAETEWWETGPPASSAAELLARTARLRGDRLVVALRDADVGLARAVAGVALVLPAGLTPLAAVEVCAEGDGAAPVFLHPRTLEAVAIVEGGHRLAVRPRARAAFARPLGSDGETALPLRPGSDRSEVDARTLAGPWVLRLAGWAGETAFTDGVEVAGARALTVAEIVAAHQAAVARQEARVRAWIATGTTALSFQVPGLPAPMSLTAESVLFHRGTLTEIEQRDLRLSGVPVAVGEDGVPRLPLVQPERVASPPLSITLGEAYRYRLEGEETAGNRACYVVAFAPAAPNGPSLRGRAWIAKDGFALVRLVATQTGLRGAIVSSRQEDEFRPIEVEGGTAWMLVRSEMEQVYEGPGHRTPIHREVAFARVELNPPDFDARLGAARASRSVLLRETADGFQYLRRRPAAEAGPSLSGAEGPAPTSPPVEAGRAPAGRASRVFSVAAGALFDPGIDRPLPFAGLSYLDFDVLGTGAQLSALLAGPFAQAALSVPSVGGPDLQIQAWAFASLARYNDRSFRGGLERYDENLRQQPWRASLAALRRLGPRTRLRAAYDVEDLRLDQSDTTGSDFVVPARPVAHALRLGLEWERGAWSATAWTSAAWRPRWREWGRPGDYAPEAQTYQRAGLTLSRSLTIAAATILRLEASGLAGRNLDRFSRFGFDAFDRRLSGYPSAGIRFDRGAVLRSAASWSARPGLRLDAFVDAAIVHDPMEGRGGRGHLGTGAALEAALPGRVLLSVDWGFGWQARDRDGGRGTHVVRITAYRVL